MPFPVFLINGNGAVIEDLVAPATTLSLGTRASISTAQVKFGAGSVALQASLTDQAVYHYSSIGDESAKLAGALNGNFTIEFWMYFTSAMDGTHSDRIISLGGYSATEDVVVELAVTQTASGANRNVAFSISGSGVHTSADTLIGPDGWCHIAIVHEAPDVRYYVNGALRGTFTWTPVTTVGSDSINLEMYRTGAFIDDFAVWGSARYSGSTHALPTEIVFTEVVETASIAVLSPHQTLAAFSGAAGYMLAPKRTLAAWTGASTALTKTYTLSIEAHDATGENALAATIPQPTLAARGGANAKLIGPAATLAAVTTVTTYVSAALTQPTPYTTSDGRASSVSSTVLRPSIAQLVGYSGAVAAVTVGSSALTVTGITGGTGRVAVTLPLFQVLEAAGTTRGLNSAALTLPTPQLGNTGRGWLLSPTAALIGIGSATVTATYEAYALNLKHLPRRGEEPTDEMTRYSNFPFTHVIRYKNSYFGVAQGALYLLEGTTDHALPTPTPTTFTIETHKSDFGVVEKKTPTYAYFGGRLGATETVSLIVGETGTESYQYTTPRGAEAQNYRQAFGRGVKARYFAIGVSGTAEFALDSLDFEFNKLTRRI